MEKHDERDEEDRWLKVQNRRKQQRKVLFTLKCFNQISEIFTKEDDVKKTFMGIYLRVRKRVSKTFHEAGTNNVKVC